MRQAEQAGPVGGLGQLASVSLTYPNFTQVISPPPFGRWTSPPAPMVLPCGLERRGLANPVFPSYHFPGFRQVSKPGSRQTWGCRKHSAPASFQTSAEGLKHPKSKCKLCVPCLHMNEEAAGPSGKRRLHLYVTQRPHF